MWCISIRIDFCLCVLHLGGIHRYSQIYQTLNKQLLAADHAAKSNIMPRSGHGMCIHFIVILTTINWCPLWTKGCSRSRDIEMQDIVV
jgi:hypothetical protein